MGFCLSCCRRRQRRKPREGYGDSERQPLLRSDTTALDSNLKHPERRTPYEKGADVLAALHTGKLPSQQQLDTALRKLLHSGVFECNGDANALDGNMRRVLENMREVVQVIILIGLEKNGDNRMQDLIYQCRELSGETLPATLEEPLQIQVEDGIASRVQTAGTSAIPSQNELASDTAALISSLRTLTTLFLTSSAFRLIVGDLLATVRDLVASSAEEIRKVAEKVERASEALEISVKPETEATIGHSASADAQPTLPDRTLEGTKSPKEVVLERIEDIFRRAQASPKYNSALRTLLYIFRKYGKRVRLAATAILDDAQSFSEEPAIQVTAPVIVPDPRFSRALQDLKTVLERFAGGKSLEPLVQTLFKTVHDASATAKDGDNNEVQTFFIKVGLWLDTALEDPSFVTSRSGRDGASKLYDDAHMLLSQDTRLSENIQHLMDEINAFEEAMKNDRSTNRFFTALDKLHNDIQDFLEEMAKKRKHAVTHWRMTLLQATLGWMFPRLLEAIQDLPMPRLEYISSSGNGTRIEAAIDALLLSAEESLVPDMLSVQEFAEVRVEVDEDVGAGELTSPNARLLSARKGPTVRSDLENGASARLLGDEANSDIANTSPNTKRKGKRTTTASTSRIRIHVEGLRVAAHDVGYYASYSRNSWLGYADEGLLSIDIGRERHRRGEGLAVDVEVELDPNLNERVENDGRLFRILDVQSAAPGLGIHIAYSRHWMLNCLLTPVVGMAGRTIGPRVLNAQIRSVLESIERSLREMKAKADEKAGYRAKELRDGAAGTTFSDWWDALLERFASEEQEDAEESEDEQEVYAETHTEANLTGVVRTTIKQPEPQSEASRPAESALVVGLGAQLLPGKAELSTLGVERESPQDAVHKTVDAGREALGDARGKAQEVREAVENAGRKGVEKAVKVRRTVEAGEERLERQERRERRRSGWRSRAFDL